MDRPNQAKLLSNDQFALVNLLDENLPHLQVESEILDRSSLSPEKQNRGEMGFEMEKWKEGETKRVKMKRIKCRTQVK